MKLYKKIECANCNGTGYAKERLVAGDKLFGVRNVIEDKIPCKVCMGLRYTLKKVDLAALDLGALIVLNEFYRRIEKTLLDTIRYGPAGKRELLNQIKVELDDLKSRHLSEPDKYKEKLVQAEAWNGLRKEVQGHIEAHISNPTWEEILGKMSRIRSTLGLERKEEEEK